MTSHCQAMDSIMRRAADYYLAEHTDFPCGWERAPFGMGLLALYNLTSDPKYLQWTKEWGDRNSWMACNYPKVVNESESANDEAIGQAYCEMYILEPNPMYIHNIRDEVLAKQVVRSKVDDWWWADAFFMAMPLYARIGHLSGDTRYHDKNFKLFNDSAVRRGLWDESAGLFFRDQSFIHKTTPHGERVFWGRANAWAIGALARTLQYLPASHPSHPVYCSYLQKMGDALRLLQNATDGMWRASLLDPQSIPNPETTATAGIVFGLAYGVNSGILDASTFTPTIRRGWQGLASIAYNSSTGAVGYCQPPGAEPRPCSHTDTSDFCVGLFLLAAKEVSAIV